MKDALSKKRFNPPPKRYYLTDARYTYGKFLLTPYPKTRYHLKEFVKAGNRPETKEELFNLRHASLRNTIERIFGIFKRKFKIVQTAPEYAINVQVNLLLALTALFNFIADRDRENDPKFINLEEFDLAATDDNKISRVKSIVRDELTAEDLKRDKMQAFRDSITQQI